MLKKADEIAREIYINKLAVFFTEKNESAGFSSEDFPSDANTTIELTKETIKEVSGRKRLTRALSEQISTELNQYNHTSNVLDDGSIRVTPNSEIVKI